MRRSIRQDRQAINAADRPGGRFGAIALPALLALTPVLAMCLGSGCVPGQHADEGPEAILAEQQAKTALSQRGVLVISNPQTKHAEHISFLGRKDLDDATLQHVAALRHVTSINLWGSGITDDQLHYLCGLPRLECLVLGDTRISDDGVATLTYSLNLPCLYLDNTNITDRSLPLLARMRSLEILYLENTNITDQSLPFIARMGSLDTLDVTNTLITEEGLKRLRSMPRLNVLMHDDIAVQQRDSGQQRNVDERDVQAASA